MTNIFYDFECTMWDIHISMYLGYNIWPCNELHGFSNEDWYFGIMGWSAANTIQLIIWVENVNLKDIMLHENWEGFNLNNFNVNFRFLWRYEITLLVWLWSATLIAIMENIWNTEVCYNKLSVSSRKCINITHHLVRSVHNSKPISQKFFWPTLHHGNTSIIFHNIFYCRTITKQIKEASP